ncbi:gamma-glutamyl-gamma-aminobutyrate hydrolase family protein [Proteobacteria bacterium 005FR1]|nr:gamma-glutamyl-gamma-aminobutyrate hydrolase family protein [Proteobacteria bacterium 005FR1]
MTWLALYRAGAKAVRITPRRPRKGLQLDAVVIGGGSDIEPSHYGETPFEDIKENRRQGSPVRDLSVSLLLFLLRILFAVKFRQGYDPKRDQLEQRLIRQALENGIPVLGICRGAQLINVVLGGSLHQNIAEFYDEEPHVRSLLPRKRIEIQEGSHLQAILQCQRCQVNALHNQAIANLGRDVKIVARDTAGVVQAIEYTEAPFAIGVQWHPEYLPQIPQQQLLFKQMVRLAAAGNIGESSHSHDWSENRKSR